MSRKHTHGIIVDWNSFHRLGVELLSWNHFLSSFQYSLQELQHQKTHISAKLGTKAHKNSKKSKTCSYLHFGCSVVLTSARSRGLVQFASRKRCLKVTKSDDVTCDQVRGVPDFCVSPSSNVCP